MLSISVSTSSQITPLNPVGRDGVRRESRCVGHRPPGRLRDSGARLTGRPAHPASTSSRTTAPHSAHGLTPVAGPLSSTAAGRTRLPVLQSGKPSRKTARLRSMAFFIQGDLRPPCSPARDASRSVNALIPRSPLSRDEAVSLLQGALTASLRRVRSSHRHISGITPPPSPGIPPHQHPASSSRPLCDRHGARKCAASAPSLPPEQHSLTAFPRLPSGPLSPSDNAHPVGSVAAAVQEKPSLARTPSAPERREEL